MLTRSHFHRMMRATIQCIPPVQQTKRRTSSLCRDHLHELRVPDLQRLPERKQRHQRLPRPPEESLDALHATLRAKRDPVLRVGLWYFGKAHRHLFGDTQ